MPRVCTICTHPERPAVDSALLAGESLRTIADRWSVSKTALLRHREDHIPAALARAQDAAEVAHADDLLREARQLRDTAYTLLGKAEQAGDYRTALAGVREARGCLELLAKLLGQLDERPVVNLLVAPEWLALRAELLGALQPYPEARVAVAGHLVLLEGARGRAG